MQRRDCNERDHRQHVENDEDGVVEPGSDHPPRCRVVRHQSTPISDSRATLSFSSSSPAALAIGTYPRRPPGSSVQTRMRVLVPLLHPEVKPDGPEEEQPENCHDGVNGPGS